MGSVGGHSLSKGTYGHPLPSGRFTRKTHRTKLELFAQFDVWDCASELIQVVYV